MEHNETIEPLAQQPEETREAPRAWVTPSFEVVPLNEALFETGEGIDGMYWSFS